ncbi:MAG: class I SAM-dependent methyltransferase [Calditrichaeota bacterium]|nr:class I SAM-dependent methyltransferase [Calditrichota bacterium]
MITRSTAHREWFRDWSGDDYDLVYAHRDQAEADRFVLSWPFFDDLPQGSWCLDLGCGAGRYLRALAGKGYRVIGLDRSDTMLSKAQQNCGQFESIYFARCDLRQLPFGSPPRIGLAVSLFTSFGYFASDREHLEVLRDVAAVVQPNGILLLDLPNPDDVRRCVRDAPMRKRMIKCERDEAGKFANDQIPDIEIEEHYRLIEVNEGLRVEKRIRITRKDMRLADRMASVGVRGTGVEVRRSMESVRLFSKLEVIELTQKAGWEPYGPLRGDYDGNPLSAASPRMIYIGRRRV